MGPSFETLSNSKSKHFTVLKKKKCIAVGLLFRFVIFFTTSLYLICLCVVRFLLQAGPLIKVKIPKDNDGNSKQFAFVNFKHDVSVPYSMHLLSGIRLYGRQLNLQYRAGRKLLLASSWSLKILYHLICLFFFGRVFWMCDRQQSY